MRLSSIPYLSVVALVHILASLCDRVPLRFTVLAEACAIMTGLASTLVLAAPPLIAAEWFPPKERTTAVGEEL